MRTVVPPLSRRELMVGTLAATVGLGLAACQQDKPRPRNLLLFLTDDQRYDALGFMGHPFLHTPNIDALARGGSWCRNSFVTTAVCSSSRATLLTGLYAHNHGVLVNGSPLREGQVTLAKLLQAAGYETAWIGKWHLGTPLTMPGFDHWFALKGHGRYDNAPFLINGVEQDVPGYVTDVITAEALRWLENRTSNKPYFLVISHKAPHHPFAPDEAHSHLFEDITPPHPAESVTEPGLPSWVKHQRMTQHGIDNPWQHSLKWEEVYLNYHRVLVSVDEGVGKVVKALSARNELDQTFITYTSDNGFLLGEHGIIDKRAIYEPSIRVPLIFHCPELIQPGGEVEALSLNLDLAPTLLEVAGSTSPAWMQGHSLLPVLLRQPCAWRGDFLYEYFFESWTPMTPTIFAMRSRRWKYAEFYGVEDIGELYDLEQDPREENNLFLDPASAPLKESLAQRLIQLKAETGLREQPNWGDGPYGRGSLK